jgi:transcriptional regulator with XRE-family HTH domain
MGCKKGVPHQKSNTWWAMLRIDRGVSISKLSSDIDIPIGALTTYFNGEHIPREYATRKICLYFDVDYELGKSKFIEDHNFWNTRHSAEWFAHDKQRESEYHKKYNKTNAIPYCVSFDRSKDRDLLDKLDTVESGKRSPYIKWVLRQHLRNDAFSLERLTPEVIALLQKLYSEIPFDVFLNVLSGLIDRKMLDARMLYDHVSYPTFLEIYRLQDKI